MQDEPGLNPPIRTNNFVCVTCPNPPGGCKGGVEVEKSIEIMDKNGTRKWVKLVLTNSICQDCPSGGLTGYDFAPTKKGWGG